MSTYGMTQTSRFVEYFYQDHLMTLTGLNQDRWDEVIVKELMDNALDAGEGSEEPRLEIDLLADRFAVFDSGPGIGEEALRKIGDFTAYASTKRLYHRPTRGFLGNALKTVLGIAFLRDYRVRFLCNGVSRQLAFDHQAIKAGQPEWEMVEQPTDDLRSGVIIDGLNASGTRYRRLVEDYRLVNPDFELILRTDRRTAELDNPEDVEDREEEGETAPSTEETVLPRISSPRKGLSKTFIDWYTHEQFDQLLNAVLRLENDRTITEFKNAFANLGRVSVPVQGRLSQLTDNDQAITQLYHHLRDKGASSTENHVKKYMIGRSALKAVYGANVDKYSSVTGTWSNEGIEVPYVLEAALVYLSDGQRSRYMPVVNRAIPYESDVFDIGGATPAHFCGAERFTSGSIQALLSETQFFRSRNALLIVSYACPYVPVATKSKTRILASHVTDELIGLIEKVAGKFLKKNEKAMGASLSKTRSTRRATGPSHKSLMYEYFDEAVQQVTRERKDQATARQLFYRLRAIVNHAHWRVNLSNHQYREFTQNVITDKVENDPDLSDLITFDERGRFTDTVTNQDVGLGTNAVKAHIEKEAGSMLNLSSGEISVPQHLRFAAVLLVEKHAVLHVLEPLIRERRLPYALMTTRGFASRAAKQLMQHFASDGIPIYVLTDLDIEGQRIVSLLQEGSHTFPEPLDVRHLGLTLELAEDWSKVELAETVTRKKSYGHVLDNLTSLERDFFVVDPEDHEYRRLELDAFSPSELMQIIEENLPHAPLRPYFHEIKDAIRFDTKRVAIDALTKEYVDRLIPRVSFTRTNIAARIHRDERPLFVAAPEIIRAAESAATERLVEELRQYGIEGMLADDDDDFAQYEEEDYDDES